MPYLPKPFNFKTKQERQRVHDQQRGTAAQRGYDARWRKERLAHLRANPLCVECKKRGLAVIATVVDHIKPHRGDQELFWDSTNNWQSLCGRHHGIKTAKGQ